MGDGPLFRDVERAIKGDRYALDAVVHASRRSVHAFAYSRLRDHEAADDVTQEALLRASKNLARLDDPSNWMPWLFGIVRHCLMEHQRAAARDKKVVEIAMKLAITPVESNSGGRVLDALEKLDDDARSLLSLKYLEGMSCKDIAHHLDRPIGSITSSLSRAYVQLRDIMQGA